MQPLPPLGSTAWDPWASDIHTGVSTIQLNVKHYGAKGDGSTDDTAAIAAAFADITTAGGGVVFFPTGTYVVSTALTLPSNVLLRGATSRTSVLKASASATGVRMLAATGGQSGITVEHLGFDAQSNTTMTRALESGGSTVQQRIKFVACYFANFVVPSGWTQANSDVGALLFWSSATAVAQILVERCEFVNCVKGVRCYYPTDSVVIRHNRFFNSLTKGMQVAIELVGGSPGVESSALIEGNHIDGANWDPSGDPGGQLGCGIVVYGSRGARITGNHLQNCGDPASQQASGGIGARASLGGGILISQGSQGAMVQANHVHDCQQHGIYIESSPPSADTTVGTADSPRGVTVSGNRVYNITGIGNAASASSRATITGINVNYSAGTTVIGNVVHDVPHPGIATDSDRCIISGNVISNVWKAVIPSVAPTLGTTTGTLPAGNYTIVYTYVFVAASGQESIVSPTATIAVNGSQGITVAALTGIPAGVTAVKFYIYGTTSTSTTGYTGVSATVTANATAGQTINAQGNSNPAPDYAVSKGGIVLVGNHSIVTGNQVFDNQTSKTTLYGVALSNGTHRVIGNDFTGVATSGVFMFGGGTTNYFSGNSNYNPVGVLSAPTVPATTVAYTNQFGVDAMVVVTGGTVTSISVGGTTTGLTSGTFRVPQNQTITIAYSVVPTWKWFGD